MATHRLASIAGLAVVGAVLTTLPHWLTGNPGWTQDYDQMAFYLPLGAMAYHIHPYRLADPTTGGPMHYSPCRSSLGCWQPDRSGLDRSVSGCAGASWAG